jgi:hypothetical protein
MNQLIPSTSLENDWRPACCLLEEFPLQAARTDRCYANPYFEFGNPLCYELPLNKQNKNTYFDSNEQ